MLGITYRVSGLACKVSYPAFCILLLAGFGAACAESVTVEVQGVAASDPGKKDQVIPASLAQFKSVLKGTLFGTFSDAGCKTIKPVSGGKDQAVVGAYTVEVALLQVRGGKAKVEVTIKQGANPIAKQVLNLSRGEPFMLEVGAKNSPTLLIFSLKGAE